MKSYYALLAFLIWTSSSFAQTLDVAYVRKSNDWHIIDKQGNFLTESLFEHDSLFRDCIAEGMVVMEKGYKYGFINLATKQTLPAIYDSVSCFLNGACMVKKNGKWIGIDKNGKEMPAFEKPFLPGPDDGSDSLLSAIPATQNQFIAPWNDMNAYTSDRILCYEVLANKNCSCHKLTNYYGFIDRKGKWVIPANYEWADIYSLGLAAVSEGSGDEKTIGYIDMDGKWAIKPIFQDCGRFRTINIK